MPDEPNTSNPATPPVPKTLDSIGFTRDLELIRLSLTEDTVTLGVIEKALEGRGFAAFALILCIPFIQPVPLPGLSIIIGFAIIAIGLRLVFARAGGLPQFLTRKEFETKALRKFIAFAARTFSVAERFFKPRLDFMLRVPFLNVVGLSIVASGIALCLPLPPVILFSNSIPAWAVIFLCLGYLERDGLVLIVGHGLAIGTWIYFGFWWEVVRYSFARIASYLGL